MKKYLEKISLEAGIRLSDETLEKFILYEKLLAEWNKKMNLTAITDKKEIAVKHFLDCIMFKKFENIEGMNVVDVGTGAGFPGIPMKLVSDIKLTLIDSLGKRINFLEEIKCRLKLENVQCVHLRAEEGGKDKKYREKFDICVSRAVAELPVLCEYCLPYVKKGGKFLAFKGSSVNEEMEKAEKALKILGGKTADIYNYELPLGIRHSIAAIQKIDHTPPKYPRNAARIKKAPLI